jgi:hypothetical protein
MFERRTRCVEIEATDEQCYGTVQRETLSATNRKIVVERIDGAPEVSLGTPVGRLLIISDKRVLSLRDSRAFLTVAVLDARERRLQAPAPASVFP